MSAAAAPGDRGNACLTCDKFATDATSLAEHTRQLTRREQLGAGRRFVPRPTRDERRNVWLAQRRQEQRALHTISTALKQPELDPAENHAIRGAGTPHAPKSMAERGNPDNLHTGRTQTTVLEFDPSKRPPSSRRGAGFVPQQQRQASSIQVPRLLFDASSGHGDVVAASHQVRSHGPSGARDCIRDEGALNEWRRPASEFRPERPRRRQVGPGAVGV